MDKKVRNENRIPGCDRYTQPDEIKELSRYLKRNKKIQEDYVEDNLVKDNLEVPGRFTGKVPKIENLPTELDKLDTTSIDINLENKIIGLDTTSSLELNTKKVDLDIDDQNIILSKTKEHLDVNTDLELNQIREGLQVQESIINLPKSLEINLSVEDDITLYNESEILTNVEENLELPNQKESIEILNKVEELDNNLITLKTTSDISQLSSDKESLVVIDLVDKLPEDSNSLLPPTVDVNKLEDELVSIAVDDNLESLPDSLISLVVPTDVSLDNSLIDLDVVENIELEDKIENLSDSISPDHDENYQQFDPTEDTLYDAILTVPEANSSNNQADYDYWDPSKEDNSLYDQVVGLFPEDSLQELPTETSHLKSSESPSQQLDYNYINLSEGSSDTVPSSVFPENLDEIPNNSAGISNVLLNPGEQETSREGYVFNLTELDKYLVKPIDPSSPELQSDYTPYNPDTTSLPEETVSPVGDSIEILNLPDNIDDVMSKDDFAKYIPPGFNINSLDINAWLRWLVEQGLDTYQVSSGKQLRGAPRQLLLNELLAFAVLGRDELEKVTKANRDRLPGEDLNILSDLVSGGISGALDNLGDRIEGALTTNPVLNPVNRPSSDENSGTEGWSDASQGRGPIGKQIAGKGENGLAYYPFKQNYLYGNGIKTTLSELCALTNPNDVSTVEQLFTALRESPYLTMPEKFTTTGNRTFRSFTLDTNAYWEIILTPYVGVLNGNKSFLPAPQEINYRNRTNHGVSTSYDKWIPFTSFELQKSKLASKSLGLYDGEISFPVSMESINELRISIADDQYKSWRLYFESCAAAAIYNTVPHDTSYYDCLGEFDASNWDTATVFDKTNICVSPYKNVTFRCTIYMLNPQYSTIKKFDLLVLLRDFAEEASGEIESGGSDLNISFSIVGENPSDTLPIADPIKMVNPPDWSPKVDAATVISEAANSIIKLIK